MSILLDPTSPGPVNPPPTHVSLSNPARRDLSQRLGQVIRWTIQSAPTPSTEVLSFAQSHPYKKDPDPYASTLIIPGLELGNEIGFQRALEGKIKCPLLITLCGFGRNKAEDAEIQDSISDIFRKRGTTWCYIGKNVIDPGNADEAVKTTRF